jgi:hypothetical protein
LFRKKAERIGSVKPASEAGAREKAIDFYKIEPKDVFRLSVKRDTTTAQRA